jgi:hypothetical protein
VTRVEQLREILGTGPQTTDTLLAAFNSPPYRGENPVDRVFVRAVIAEGRRGGLNITTTPKSLATPKALWAGKGSIFSLSDDPAPRRPRGGAKRTNDPWSVDDPGEVAVGSTVTVRNGALVITCKVTSVAFRPGGDRG